MPGVPMHPTLRTRRLLFRRFGPEDATVLADLDADPEVIRWVHSGPPPTVVTYRDEILPQWIGQYGGPALGILAAHERATGEFVGWFHLQPENDDTAVQDLGFRLHRRFWGRGLATEGGCALVSYGFLVQQCERITAHCLCGNLASIRVLEKCGLRRTRKFEVDASLLPGADEAFRQAWRFELSVEEVDPRTGLRATD